MDINRNFITAAERAVERTSGTVTDAQALEYMYQYAEVGPGTDYPLTSDLEKNAIKILAIVRVLEAKDVAYDEDEILQQILPGYIPPRYAQPTPTRPTSATSQVTPSPASQYTSAEDDLNQAWNGLLPRMRTKLREDERMWIKYKDSLPIEERNREMRSRAAYLRSLTGQ